MILPWFNPNRIFLIYDFPKMAYIASVYWSYQASAGNRGGGIKGCLIWCKKMWEGVCYEKENCFLGCGVDYPVDIVGVLTD